MLKYAGKLDAYIRTQMSLIYGELFFLLCVILFCFLGSVSGAYDAASLSGLVYVPYFIGGLLMTARAFFKIFCRSLFGSDAMLYQSLPVSAAVQVIARIFAAGILLTAYLMPIFWVGLSFVGRILYRTSFTLLVPQVLINLGWHPAKAPLFAALMLVSLIAFCFTLAALALLAAEAVETSKSGGKNRTFLVVLAGVADLVILIAVNLLPYLLVTGARIGEPALVPAGVLAVNILLGGACGWLSVNLLEKHYRLEA